MGRKNKKSNNRSARGDSMVLPFHVSQTITQGAGGGFTVNANPTGIGGPVLIEADTWAFFRLRRLRFRMLRTSAAVTTSQAGGYVGSVQDTPPATFSSVMNLLPSTILSNISTVPSSWVNVSRGDLSGAFPWYKTIPGTADPTEESPGMLVFAGASGDVFQLEIEGVLQFKTMVSAGNTPSELQARQLLRDARIDRERSIARNAILRVLSPGTRVADTGFPSVRM